MVPTLFFHKLFYYFYLILCAAMIIHMGDELINGNFGLAIFCGIIALLQWWFAGITKNVIGSLKVG